MPFPWMAAAIAASAGASVWGAHSANRANRASAREQMAFQERMSSTAHQRQMQDMQKAGLNPALSGKYGGASSPGGSSFNSVNEMEGLPGAVSSALAVRRLKSELENMDAQRDLTRSQIELNQHTARKVDAETMNINVLNRKQKLLQPLYDEAGNLIQHGVNTAKKVLPEVFQGKSKSVISDKTLKQMYELGLF